ATAADANAAAALRLETGNGASALAQTIPGALPSVPIEAASVGSAVAAALTHRAEISSARQNVTAALASVGAARRATFPTLIVGTGFARGVDSGQRVAGPTVSAQFELPLSNARVARVAQARASLLEVQARLAGVQRQVEIDVGAAVRNLAASTRATGASVKARDQAQQALTATELGYRSGASSSLERATARATYADARLNELAAIYDEALARAIVALETGA
ncbi:MAG: TolC family protein, partial [Candidatus Eremiobacteraeota bacterium]|nr:TolC family protein [Candidatus Eremiobacteraeota bacterium]